MLSSLDIDLLNSSELLFLITEERTVIQCLEERTGDALQPGRMVLDRSCNSQTGLTPESTPKFGLTPESTPKFGLTPESTPKFGLTPESTPKFMQTSESVMTKGLIEASPVSVQAHQRNKQCLLTKDYKIDSQCTDHNQRNEQSQLTKDYKTSIEEKHCQIDSQNTDHNTLLYSSCTSTFPDRLTKTSTFPDILTKTKGPCLTEYDNGSQPFKQISFSTSFESDSSKNAHGCHTGN